MGYTMMTCTRCGDSSKTDYTKATGHKPGDWIIDKQPTADSEGSKHKECTECGEKLDTKPIEKIYNSGTTDSKGQAVVGGYLVTVTDTEDKTPVSNASVVLNKDNSISIRLPNSTQGRIRLSQDHREYAGIEREAVIMGLVNRFEIWNPARLKASLDEQKLEDVTGELAASGIDFAL